VTTAAVRRIVSGGQTGVDRAALDVALELGLECGGWCPRGRRAEDGEIPARYPLRETRSAGYPVRTERNVRDSDATLVLHEGRLGRGTALTAGCARRLGRPLLEVDLRRPPA
jgi:Circularly permutated YpsA SLOG family